VTREEKLSSRTDDASVTVMRRNVCRIGIH